MSNVEKVVKIYKSLAQVPALVGAKLVNNQTAINSIWSQRNLERGKSTKFVRTIAIFPDLTKVSESLPFDVSTEILASISPSERLRAVLREANDKQFLEIWKNYNLSRVVDLNALDVHGNVYADGEFGTFCWSPDETKLMYIAELKVSKSEPFYKRSGKKEEPDTAEKTKGEEYLYKEDWGEQLVGKKTSVIAQYNIETDGVDILTGIPDDLCPAQVQYSLDGSYVVGVAYESQPRKLGLIYCSNRASTIFALDFKGNYVPLVLNGKSVKSPVITPDGKTLVWLQRNSGGPHAAAMALMKATLPLTKETTPSLVVDVVRTETQTDNGRNFYGLFNNGFPKRCFASGNRLLLSTNQRNSIDSYIIDVDSGKITELTYKEGSQIVLDVVNDVVLVNRRNFLKQDVLAAGKLPPKDSKLSSQFYPVNWVELTRNQVIEGLESCNYHYMDLTCKDEGVKNFTAIYLGPQISSEKSVPLIVWPHGGPHSAFANNLSLEASLFLSMGFAVLLINYRGSIGSGQDSIEFLPGRIGKADVFDCILATETALRQFPSLDASKMVLVGGSHGGFLVAHLSGQFPDMFKAVIARNPVIDVASMSIISDIPDWCYVEAGHEYTQKGKPDADILLAMRKTSPIEHAHKVKAPTLLQIGSNDLRVPCHQGLEYYTRLKANGVTVRLNLYDDNHPLGSVPNEMDNLINTILWIQKHLE